MDVGVDEARHGREAAAVDLGGAPISLVRADDAVAGDGDVTGFDLARGEVEDTDVFYDEVGWRLTTRLLDDVGEFRLGELVPHHYEIGLGTF